MFDRVEWGCMFETLSYFGFGDNFLRWVKILHSNPQAEVMINNIISAPFPLYRGTRQGCPLSPMLFVLALKPFAIAIRNHSVIKGIHTLNLEHCLALYADDTLLFFFLSDLTNCIPALLELIDELGRFSGYKDNKETNHPFYFLTHMFIF